MPNARIASCLRTGPKSLHSAFSRTRHAERYAAFGIALIRCRRIVVIEAPFCVMEFAENCYPMFAQSSLTEEKKQGMEWRWLVSDQRCNLVILTYREAV